MRLISKLFLLLVVVVLAVFLVVRVGWLTLFSLRAGHGTNAGLESGGSAKAQAAPDAHPATNIPEGFYVGHGEQRAYVDYATRDPVLRSFMQSVMEGNSDPNTKGKEIFLKICAACHQRDGEGKENLAPPLAGSEWVLAPSGARLARIVLNGLSGPVQVEGKDWNLAMPPLRENLSDDQVAVVLTYVRSQVGGNQAGRIPSALVASARRETHEKPETSEELLRISDQ